MPAEGVAQECPSRERSEAKRVLNRVALRRGHANLVGAIPPAADRLARLREDCLARPRFDETALARPAVD